MSGMLKENLLDRSRHVAGQVQDILRQRILTMELVPGAVLSRALLQAEFGVSQTPVRDALMRLQEEGLVDVYPQYATAVSRIDVDHARQAHFLRMAVEAEAVGRLTQTSPRETAADLQSILARQRLVALPDAFDLFDDLDRDFHRKLYERADIMQLWQMVRRQSVHFDRLRRLNLPMPGKMETVLADHRELVEAIGSGKPDRAMASLRHHLSGTLSIIDVIGAKFPDYVRG